MLKERFFPLFILRMALVTIILVCGSQGRATWAANLMVEKGSTDEKIDNKKGTPSPESGTEKPAIMKEGETSPRKILEDDSSKGNFKLYLLGFIAAFGLMLPLPLSIYHLRRVKALMDKVAEQERQVYEQKAAEARVESLLSRNERLETEMKQLQERYRVSMSKAQEKYQNEIERYKGEIQKLESENKRISGLLLIKEQVSKKG